ncbi:uncharacterized protein LOC125328641 [Corvus hawaiiensis]|uniref:uncharacterized protein LOC125328641 n=1 Tax=Corvus hawaiiensis TaxID=134902 RepID=UPI002019E309|nr:uncharacterized protein LOC125328641 [Corvus hawaiiensis]
MDTPRSSLELERKGPGQESIISELDQLWRQVSSLQGLASDLQGEKDKIRQLEHAVRKLREDGAKWKAGMSDQLSLQLGKRVGEVFVPHGTAKGAQWCWEHPFGGKRHHLRDPMEAKSAPAPIKLSRSALLETKQELEELRETRKSMLDQLMSRRADQPQEQMDKLMAMVSMRQEQEKAACSRCSSDTRVHVGELFLHYEKLQELAHSLESRLPMVGCGEGAEVAKPGRQ